MITLDCPECDEVDSINIKVEFDPEDQGYHANLDEQSCECLLTETQMETLYEDACERYTESDEDDY